MLSKATVINLTAYTREFIAKNSFRFYGIIDHGYDVIGLIRIDDFDAKTIFQFNKSS